MIIIDLHIVRGGHVASVERSWDLVIPLDHQPPRTLINPQSEPFLVAIVIEEALYDALKSNIQIR